MNDDDRSASQKEADEKLERAVNDVIRAYELVPSGSILLNSRFCLIGNSLTHVDGQDGRCYWKMWNEGGIDLNYDEARGMLRRGLEEIENEYRIGVGDGEG